MSAGTILYEARNLTLSSGTGIATYARSLVQTARGLGYDTDALIATAMPLDRRDPVLNDVHLYDARRRLPFMAQRKLDLAYLLGAPFGIETVRVGRTGTVIDPHPGALDAFGNIHAATRMFEISLWHFQRYGRRAVVKLPKPPSLFHATHAVPLQVRGCPNIYTIHDVVPLRLPYATLDNKDSTLGMMRDLCRNAEHIVTVSEFSRRDIIKVLGIDESRITNTYQCIDIPPELSGRPEGDIANALDRNWSLGHRDYFLFLGAIEPKKNLSRLIDAYARSKVSRPLIIVGGLGWQYEADLERINDEKFLSYRMSGDRLIPERRVRRLQHLPFANVVTLIQGARAVLFPSVYEGFGLPVLEAMTLGTPVLTSKAASLEEIAGDAALLVDPTDIDDIARGIRTLDEDAGLREELASKGRKRAEFFAPDRYRERIGSLYRRLLGSSPA
jgi:glycosyltransferase involved in cell wall biosynthesis